MSEIGVAGQAERAEARPSETVVGGRRGRDPWRKPRALEFVTWGYILWSLLPVGIAVLMSFSGGRSISTWQGFSFRWWWGDEQSLFHDAQLHHALFQSLFLSVVVVVVALPLGVAFAIGLDRYRGRGSGTANFLMLFSFVLPEIIVGIAMFLVITYLLKFVLLGTTAQILGLVTYQISYPVIIVRARLLSIGREYEEAAMDLGASPNQSVRRVLLPMLWPAIFVSAALVFADTIDDFVTVRYLSGAASSEPLSVKIYNAARGSPTPAVNAAASFLLFSSLIVIALGTVLYRRATRGQRSAVSEFAAQM